MADLQKLVDDLQRTILGEDIAHRAVLVALIEAVFGEGNEIAGQHAMETALSVARNASFGGFSDDEASRIHDIAQHKVAAMFTARRIRPNEPANGQR